MTTKKISSSVALLSLAVAAAAFAAESGKRGDRFVPRNDDFRASVQRAAGQGSSPECCPSDINCDGFIDGADLGLMLGSWGACSGCAADVNGDGVVNGADLGLLLGGWGACSG